MVEVDTDQSIDGPALPKLPQERRHPSDTIREPWDILIAFPCMAMRGKL